MLCAALLQDGRHGHVGAARWPADPDRRTRHQRAPAPTALAHLYLGLERQRVALQNEVHSLLPLGLAVLVVQALYATAVVAVVAGREALTVPAQPGTGGSICHCQAANAVCRGPSSRLRDVCIEMLAMALWE